MCADSRAWIGALVVVCVHVELCTQRTGVALLALDAHSSLSAPLSNLPLVAALALRPREALQASRSDISPLAALSLVTCWDMV